MNKKYLLTNKNIFFLVKKMKSGIQGLILAFIGTLTIFALAKKDIFKKNPISLSFLTEKTIDDIREDFCSKSSSDLNSF